MRCTDETKGQPEVSAHLINLFYKYCFHCKFRIFSMELMTSKIINQICIWAEQSNVLSLERFFFFRRNVNREHTFSKYYSLNPPLLLH